MTRTPFDAIVIGGGITGAGVLRDLALRGYRGLLLEKGDLGAATTASSSHLIHGGLRYLLYDRLTTHATCWDSGHITRIARPLLTRLPILWPVYRDHRRGLETVETLLESYDSFQPLKEGKKHLRLSALETRRLMPGLKEGGLLGGLLFDEYWVDAVNLVKANTDAACRGGAEVRVGALFLVSKNQTLRSQKIGVRIRFEGGKETTLWASVVINAAGPWANEVASLAGASIPLRHQKGSHLFTITIHLGRETALSPWGSCWRLSIENATCLFCPERKKHWWDQRIFRLLRGNHSIRNDRRGSELFVKFLSALFL
jgi:glycerol-3-phosphate dehydrogenase